WTVFRALDATAVGKLILRMAIGSLASPPQWGSTRAAGDRAPHLRDKSKFVVQDSNSYSLLLVHNPLVE
ncbi:MAG: hypothetical protein IJ100_06970, partial [Lachnospiraceae bacterium]|nr:hypothetical protein [Lachnospiraceae bacterium]